MILTIAAFLWYSPLKHFLLHQENSHPHEKLSHLSMSNKCWCEEKSLKASRAPNVMDDKSVIWEHLKCFWMFWCWFDNPQLSLATYFQFCLWTIRQSRGRDGVRYILLCQEISRFCSSWRYKSYKCHYVTLITAEMNWLDWIRSWIRFPDPMLTSLQTGVRFTPAKVPFISICIRVPPTPTPALPCPGYSSDDIFPTEPVVPWLDI